MAPAAKVVPWIAFSEWLWLYRCLFSSAASERVQGLARVAAWRARGKIPLAVESTALFIDAALRDDSHVFSDLELRHYYSIIFIRFVNGILDMEQKKVYAQSISRLADTIQLPGLFVELRHQATHGDLPALDLLRLAAHLALDWLDKRYWQTEVSHQDSQESDMAIFLHDYEVKVGAILKSGEKPTSKQNQIASIARECSKLDIFPYSILIRKLFMKCWIAIIEKNCINADLLTVWWPLLKDLVASCSEFRLELALKLMQSTAAIQKVAFLRELIKDSNIEEKDLKALFKAAAMNPSLEICNVLKTFVHGGEDSQLGVALQCMEIMCSKDSRAKRKLSQASSLSTLSDQIQQLAEKCFNGWTAISAVDGPYVDVESEEYISSLAIDYPNYEENE